MPSRKFSMGAVFVLLTASLALSQDTRGTITGRVTDPSGAVIAGASVVVRNTAMGIKSTLTTNSDGIYRAPLLNPGIYEVEATSAGFKKAIRQGVEVRVADNINISIA